MKKLSFFFALLLLVACAGSGDKADKSLDKNEQSDKVEAAKIKTEDLICPQVAILEAVEETMDYGDEKPDPDQLVAKARMRGIKGDCAYRKDGIDISFTLQMISERGPRLGKQVSFPYFIALVDPAENILSRQVMTASFKFSNSAKIATDDEEMHVFIPLALANQQAGPDYRVLTGFEKPHHSSQP